MPIDLFLFKGRGVACTPPFSSWGFSWEGCYARLRDGNAFGSRLHNRHNRTIDVPISDSSGFSRHRCFTFTTFGHVPPSLGALRWANLWAMVVGVRASNQGIAWTITCFAAASLVTFWDSGAAQPQFSGFRVVPFISRSHSC